MLRLADFCYRRRRLVLIGWIVALVVVFALGGALPAQHRASYETPGAESTAAYDLLKARFPARQGDSIKLVFAGDIDSSAVEQRVESIIARAEKQPHVASVDSPYTSDGSSQVSENRRVAYAEVHFDLPFDKLANADADFQKKFLDAMDPGKRAGLDFEVTTFIGNVKPGSEFVGLIFAALILLLAFGSLLAMGLPLLTALFGLGIGSVLGAIASRIIETPEWASTVAIMIGLGTGIDYSLFIITRYRQSLQRGHTPREATLKAMGTAGRAVLFAGSTVVISLLGMITMGLGYLHGVAGSSVLAVLSVLAASLTLLPAILGFVGTNIDKWRVPGTGRESHQGERAYWYRWSRVVQHRPWTAFISAAAVLLDHHDPALLVAPRLSRRRKQPALLHVPARVRPPDQGLRPGLQRSAPARGRPGQGVGSDAALGDITDAVESTKDVAFVTPAAENSDGDTAIITVFPSTKPQDEATSQLVHRLRGTVLPSAVRGTGTAVLVGGFTAISIDQSSYISARLPLFIGAVVFLSFLLLMMVFRSPLVALKAGIMNLLSIAAAYGVMTYAVQGNWFGKLLGIPETPIPAFIPMIAFAILFGLSMDYEVFLLSRIREEYVRTGDNRAAVADGLAVTARVITAAAAIMVFVFGVFIFDPNVFIKQIGLGLTAAVLIDATVVRMVLVPATMELLGDANWWMPRWLDRILPAVHVESEEVVEAELAALLASEPAEV